MTLPLEHIEGKYEILHKIKEGGMGAIYKVRHRLLEEVRVIKVIRPQFAEDLDLQRRFAREAKTAIRLRHPNIAQLYDFAAEEDGAAYMVMEFIDGHTLQETLQHHGPLSLGLAVELLRQALNALDYLHRQGYVHRDISPDNLMMTRDFDQNPMIKLIDLGIVKRLGAEVNLTTTGTFLGKVRYSSPEQFNAEVGSAQVDARSDVYSFGLLTYELLTGRFPIAGDNFSQLLAGHLMQPPLDFAESDPNDRIPVELRSVILRALEKKPQDRFDSAKEFSERLKPFTEDVDAYRHEFARRIAGRRETRPAGPAPRPGSTQERLNEQFGVEPTPKPSELTPPPPPPEDPEAARARQEAARAEAEKRQREAKVAELLGRALETKEDDPDAAQEALQELLELQPEHARARGLLERIDREKRRRRKEAERQEAERRRARALEEARAEIAALLDQGDLEGAGDRLRFAARQLDAELPELHERLETLQADAARRAEAERLYEKAREEVEAERWSEAHDLLEQVLDLVDEHSEGRELLDRVEAELERLESERQAQRQRAEALEVARTEIAGLLDQEDPDGAEARLEQAEEELEAELPELRVRIAELRDELARRAGARERIGQARTSIEANELQQARDLLLQALQASPDHPDAQKLLREVDAEIRRQEEEAERTRRLTEAMGEIERHLEEGEVDVAAQELDFAVETWGGSQELVELARRIDQEKRHRERQEALRTLLSQAREHREAGRPEEAARALRELLTLQPEHREARALLSAVDADVARGEIERAAAAVRPKATPEPAEPEPPPRPRQPGAEREPPAELPADARATIPVGPLASEDRLEPSADTGEEPVDAWQPPPEDRSRLPLILGAAAAVVLVILLLLWLSAGSGEATPEASGQDTEETLEAPPASGPESLPQASGGEPAPSSGAGQENPATTQLLSARSEPEPSSPPRRQTRGPEPRRAPPAAPPETEVADPPEAEPESEPASQAPAPSASPEPEPTDRVADAGVSDPVADSPSREAISVPPEPQPERASQPEPTVSSEEPVETQASIVPPKKLHTPRPIYPMQARRAPDGPRKPVHVTVVVEVDEQGRVSKVRVREADDSGLGFNEAALAAARRAIFRPGSKDGVPTAMWRELTYVFDPMRVDP